MNNQTSSDEKMRSKVALQSAMVYLPITLGAALIFLGASSFTGQYPIVARLGGAVWVGLLSLIISMPVVTDRIKKQVSR